MRHILARICSFAALSKLPSVTVLAEQQGDTHRSAYHHQQREGCEKNHCYCLHVFKFKKISGASGVEPVKDPSVTLLVHRCPHGLGGGRTRLTT